MNLEEIIGSKFLKQVLCALGGVILIFIVFATGMFVGYRKAEFSYRWGENYHRNFGGPPPPGFMPDNRGGDFLKRDFINAHGTAGTILKIELSAASTSTESSSTVSSEKNPILIIKGNDNVEKTVIVTDGTVIFKKRDNIKITDLNVDDQVVIIGNPDDAGRIEAKFIRTFNK